MVTITKTAQKMTCQGDIFLTEISVEQKIPNKISFADKFDPNGEPIKLENLTDEQLKDLLNNLFVLHNTSLTDRGKSTYNLTFTTT